jgi:hypothetical protein
LLSARIRIVHEYRGIAEIPNRQPEIGEDNILSGRSAGATEDDVARGFRNGSMKQDRLNSTVMGTTHLRERPPGTRTNQKTHNPEAHVAPSRNLSIWEVYMNSSTSSPQF